MVHLFSVLKLDWEKSFRNAPLDASTYSIFLWTVRILESWKHRSLILNGGLINSIAPVWDTNMEFVSAFGTLFVITEFFDVANGQIFGSLETAFLEFFNQKKKLLPIVDTMTHNIFIFQSDMQMRKKYWRGLKL